MRRNHLLAILATLLLAGGAHAAKVPGPSKGDPRVRYAEYDPDEVYTIFSKIGVPTTILFEADEKILDMPAGETEAWSLGTLKSGNGLTFKPKVTLPDSVIQVITNKRTYNFDVALATKPKGYFMIVRFRYPAVQQAADRAAKERADVDKLLAAENPAANRRYSVSGSSEIAPVEAWDDGSTTYLRFSARQGLPAVYSERGDGGDALQQIENARVNGDRVEIPGVHRKLVLQTDNGRRVACVYNDGYSQAAPRPATNTASPLVKRVLKGDRK
jgi:type IV secretion system protein VirB9